MVAGNNRVCRYLGSYCGLHTYIHTYIHTYTYTYVHMYREDPTTAVSWEKAIGYVGISGAAMVLLSITFLVEKSMSRVPNHIKLGTIIGIGMLLVSFQVLSHCVRRTDAEIEYIHIYIHTYIHTYNMRTYIYIYIYIYIYYRHIYMQHTITVTRSGVLLVGFFMCVCMYVCVCILNVQAY
jgi:xanthine/uracil/vitamin C permease (AzgA family)